MGTCRSIKFFVSVSAAVTICSVFISAKNNTADVRSLTPEYLVSAVWGPENRVGMKLKFPADGRFESAIDYGQSYSDGAGTYLIKDGKLFLIYETSTMDPEIKGLTLKNGVLITDMESPKYRRYLLFKAGELGRLYIREDLKIWDYSSLVREGELLSVRGVDAIAVGGKSAVTSAVVKVRETPGISGKEINYTYEDEEGTKVTVRALPKDTSLTVLARTKDKDRVGKWNNYWYYVEFEKYIEYTRGWVYGEFVEMK